MFVLVSIKFNFDCFICFDVGFIIGLFELGIRFIRTFTTGFFSGMSFIVNVVDVVVIVSVFVDCLVLKFINYCKICVLYFYFLYIIGCIG